MRYLKLKLIYVNYNGRLEPTSDVVYLNEDKILMYKVETDSYGKKYVVIDTTVVCANTTITLKCDFSALNQLNPSKDCENKL